MSTNCPWCDRVYLKDDNCNYIFACGLDENGFQIGRGCGRAFCHECGKKFCGQQYDPETGLKLLTYRDTHDSVCCTQEIKFLQEEYCPGNHNSHCNKRW